MALRAREEDENGIEWGVTSSGGWYHAGTMSPIRKPTQVRPEEQNVATRKGRARGGKVSVFPHLTLVIGTGER